MAKLNSIDLAPTSTGVITTDATPTVAATYDTSLWTNAAFNCIIQVLGYDTVGFNEVGGYVIAATFKREAGSLAIVGTATALHTAENTAAWAAAATASGNNITITVTGAAATTVQWIVKADITVNVATAVRGDN